MADNPYPETGISQETRDNMYPENMTTKDKYLYDVAQLENCLSDAGWKVTYQGLLKRYLCHAQTGAIIYIQHDKPMDSFDELLIFIIRIEAEFDAR